MAQAVDLHSDIKTTGNHNKDFTQIFAPQINILTPCTYDHLQDLGNKKQSAKNHYLEKFDVIQSKVH